MRISTSTIFDTGVYGMEQQQSAMFTTQQQLSTGLRVYTPSIDPVAAARALEVGQSNSINTQYQTNQDAALSRLNLNEANLQSVTTLIQNVQVQAVNAGNSSLTVTERQAIASQLTSLQQQLVSLANSTDGAGNYLFSGSMAGTKPFVQTQNGVQYLGDNGQQSIQITSSRQIQVSFSGADIFQNIKTGNGSFTTSAATANTGTGVIDTGTLTDPTKWNVSGNSKNFSIKFAVSNASPPVTTYDLVDNSTGISLLTGTASSASGPYPATYTSGSSIAIKQATATASASIAAATAADASASAAAADTAAAGTVSGATLNAAGSEAYTAAYNAAIAGGASAADAAAAAGAIQSAAQAGGATATAITAAATAAGTISAAVTAATGGTVTSSIATYAANAAATVIANAAANAAGTQAATSDFGASVAITGIPANGDTFSINQSTNESIFTTIGNLISALNSTSTGPAANATLSNKLNEIGQNLNNDLNNVLTVRAANGAWVNETTTAQTTSGNLGLQYQSTISNLQDLDYTKAISQLNQETTMLQAAQKSFAQVSGLSLFSYIA